MLYLAAAGCEYHNAYHDRAKIAAAIEDINTRKASEVQTEVIVQKPILSTLLGRGDADSTLSEPPFKETVADSLARIGSDAVPMLIVALDDQHADVRQYAARALAVMGDKAAPAVPALVKHLHDPEENVRRASVRALGQIGPSARDAVPALIDLLKKE